MVDLIFHLPFILGFKDVNKMNLMRPAYFDMFNLQIHLGLQWAQQDESNDTVLFLTSIFILGCKELNKKNLKPISYLHIHLLLQWATTDQSNGALFDMVDL